MRRLFALSLGLGLLSASAYADVIDFTPFAGYTTVTMGQVNKGLSQVNAFDKIEELSTPNVSDTDTPLSSAWIIGGDLLSKRLTPLDSLSLGLRGEYLATNTGSDTLYDADEPGGVAWSFKESGTLTSVMLGGRYQLPGADWGLNLSAGAFAGLGYATMTQDELINVERPGSTSTLYQGEGFVGDLDLRLDWAIPGLTWLHLDAQSGYRYASLGDLSSHGQTMGSPFSSLLSLLTNKPVNTGAVSVDFSGLTAEGGLSVNF